MWSESLWRISNSSAHGVLRVCMTRKWALHACRKNLLAPATISWRLFAHFCTRRHAASVGLQHAHMNVSVGLSDACTTLYLLARMFPCCKSRRDISSSFCHWAEWAALHRASVAETHACMFIHTRMHANSYSETVTCMRGLHNGEICFTSMDAIFKRS